MATANEHGAKQQPITFSLRKILPTALSFANLSRLDRNYSCVAAASWLK
jgi:hypothetical protein